MKKFTIILLLPVLLAPACIKTISAQSRDTGQRQFHIKIEKIEDGKKMKLDTVVTGDEPFIWNGDTIRPGQSAMIMGSDDATVKKFSYATGNDLESGIIILKKNPGNDSLEVTVKSNDEDSHGHREKVLEDETVQIWNGEGGHSWIFSPGHPGPDRNHRFIYREKENKNVIDLSDPDIISYKKKLLKDGTEKITIIRKQKRDSEKPEEITIKNKPVYLHGQGSVDTQEIEVFKSDDGKTVITDPNGETFEVEGGEGIKIIKKDGKVYRIKESDEGKNKKIEVEVESNEFK